MSNVWHDLQVTYQLSNVQIQSLQWYYHEMVTWNRHTNLTRITDETDVVAYHFADALEITRHYPIDQCTAIVDVGTGAGVPGIPLKIMYPHLEVTLIEVVHKKVRFLEHIIRGLHLQRIQVSDYDWRTFVRKTDYPADVVMARASLQPSELVRMFKPSSSYKAATCIYWAAANWQPSKAVAPYVDRTITYTVADRNRQYILLSRS